MFDAVVSRAVRASWKRAGVDGLVEAKFIGRPIFSTRAGATIRIGAGFTAVSSARRQVIGVNHPTIIRAIDSAAHLTIGEHCGVSGATIVCKNRIEIGDGCLLGANVLIADTDFHPVHSIRRRHAAIPERDERHSVLIGDDVFIGSAAIILKGTTIGDHAVVGAGAVVSGKVEAGSIVAGNPARVVSWVRGWAP
jgi:acetyltransferase-like isoleucine patch superfamily enzyme